MRPSDLFVSRMGGGRPGTSNTADDKPGGEPAKEPTTEPKAVGAFVTPQSLASFTGAAAVVSVLWALVGRLHAPLADAEWIPMLLGLLIALFLWWITVSDPDVKMTRRETWIALVIAVFNGALLAMAALGVVAETGG